MFVLEYDTNQGGIVMKKTLGIILLMATMLFTFMPSVYAKGHHLLEQDIMDFKKGM